MKKNIEGVMKDYFEAEVSSRTVPDLPEAGKVRRIRKDNFFLTICAAAGLILLFQPGLNANVLRRSVISQRTYEMLKDDFSRVIFDASQEYKNNKGVSYD